MATTSPTTNGKNNNSTNTILASSFIPLEPEEISAEWLFEVINQYRKLKEMSLVKEADDLLSCEIKEKKSSKGRLSSTYIIEIKFKCFTSMGNEECSMGFFLKLLPSAAIINGEKNRNAARRNKVFQREVNVTFGILPQIQKAALTKGLSLAIPEIVYGSHDTKGNGVVLLIGEEKRGYLSPKQYSGLSMAEVREVIDQISQIHAVSTAMFLSNDLSLTESVSSLERIESDAFQAIKEELDLVFRSLAHFLRRVPGYSEGFNLIDKYRPALIETVWRGSRSVQLPLKCLTHGEMYDRNILFKHTRRSKVKSEGKRPNFLFGNVDFAHDDDEDDSDCEEYLVESEKAGSAGGESKTHAGMRNTVSGDSNFDISAIITDWKYASVSSPNADLAYFFLSSTNQSMRDKYTQDWLEQYYFSFTECLRSKFGIKLANSHSEFDFDVFVKDFQKHLQRAYLQAVLTLTRELRFLENEFHYVKDNQEAEILGKSLRYIGRRLLELVDEFIVKVCTKDWRKENYHWLKKAENNNEETVSATIKVGGGTTVVGK